MMPTYNVYFEEVSPAGDNFFFFSSPSSWNYWILGEKVFDFYDQEIKFYDIISRIYPDKSDIIRMIFLKSCLIWTHCQIKFYKITYLKMPNFMKWNFMQIYVNSYHLIRTNLEYNIICLHFRIEWISIWFLFRIFDQYQKTKVPETIGAHKYFRIKSLHSVFFLSVSHKIDVD